MAAEPRSNSEATVRLPKMSAEATVQISASEADAAQPPPAPEAMQAGTVHPTPVAHPPLSPQEKAQRRLIKNLVMGGFFVVVLIIVFYFLSR